MNTWAGSERNRLWNSRIKINNSTLIVIVVILYLIIRHVHFGTSPHEERDFVSKSLKPIAFAFLPLAQSILDFESTARLLAIDYQPIHLIFTRIWHKYEAYPKTKGMNTTNSNYRRCFLCLSPKTLWIFGRIDVWNAIALFNK